MLRIWLPYALIFIMLNGFALFVGGQTYTAWSIRTRNLGYYMLLGRTTNLDRANRADEIAAEVVRWLRPLLLVVANLAWLVLVLYTHRVAS